MMIRRDGNAMMRRPWPRALVVPMTMLAIVATACGPLQGTQAGANGTDGPPSADPDPVVTVHYDMVTVDGGDVRTGTSHEFIARGWDRWLDVVVASRDGQSLGTWQAYDGTHVVSGVFHPEAATAIRADEEPASLGPSAEDFTEAWRADAGSFAQDSIHVSTVAADTEVVDAETGETRVEPSHGEAPSGLMNPRFSADEDSFAEMETMQDASAALTLVAAAARSQVSDGESLVRHVASELDRDPGDLRFTALSDTVCATCYDTVAVWDEAFDIPLVAFDVDTENGQGQGLLVRELIVDDEAGSALLDAALSAVGS